jgi:hypothetical protein
MSTAGILPYLVAGQQGRARREALIAMPPCPATRDPRTITTGRKYGSKGRMFYGATGGRENHSGGSAAQN